METKQQDVSCFLWPIFTQKNYHNYNSFVEQTSVSNMITSPAASQRPLPVGAQIGLAANNDASALPN